jgi:VIT1/CCC1 family predicted Fe2+/Mn2+ transporter
MVLIFVEAFSMGVGSLLSENSAEEYERKKVVPFSASLGYAAVMFISYLISGFVILVPYLFASGTPALVSAIAIAVAGLFALGAWSGRMARVGLLKRGSIMAIIGGLTIILGILVGRVVSVVG